MDASQTTEIQAPGLGRKIGLAWAALAWERTSRPLLLAGLGFLGLAGVAVGAHAGLVAGTVGLMQLDRPIARSLQDSSLQAHRFLRDRADEIKVPVVITGGWWDIFQRGEPLLFEKMKNSPHKVWFQMPRYHSAPDPSIWANISRPTKRA